MVSGIGSSGSSSHLRYLDKANNEKEKSLAKLSSGKMNPLENPAAAAIVAELEADVKMQDQAARNTGDAASLIAVAEGAMQGISESVDRIRELTVQASNGTYSDDQRQAMQAEAEQLSQEINRTLQSTEFNGQKVFDSQQNPQLTVQVGTGSDSNSTISLATGDLAQQASSLTTIDLSSESGRASALSALDNFQGKVTSQRSDLGAFQSRLDVAGESARQSSDASEAAASRIRDIDYAEETAKLTASSIKANVATAMSAHANLSQQAVMRLLQ